MQSTYKLGISNGGMLGNGGAVRLRRALASLCPNYLKIGKVPRGFQVEYFQKGL